jgi:hypothetical protein
VEECLTAALRGVGSDERAGGAQVLAIATATLVQVIATQPLLVPLDFTDEHVGYSIERRSFVRRLTFRDERPSRQTQGRADLVVRWLGMRMHGER